MNPATDPQSEVRLLPFGGLGEIGLNMLAVECRGKLLIIDCGLMFPEPHMLGIDLVLPDIGFLRDRNEDILAVLLTHGHEDHIGALPYLFDSLGAPPVYGTPLTLALLENRLDEQPLSQPADLRPVALRTPFDIGPFEIEFFRVAHSIVDGAGLAIRTPVGTLVHTGDFKFDPSPVDGQKTDIDFLRRLGDEGVRLLFADSTNVERPGHTLSESSVGQALEQLLHGCSSRAIVATFSSNIHRIQQVFDAAFRCNRKVLVNGRSMVANIAVARRIGCLDIRDSQLVDLQTFNNLPPDQVLLLTTGSQGEPLSALSRMASGDHRQLTVEPGDTVILSSKLIPGNEKAIYSLINQLYRRGAEVHYETTSEIHVSGHAAQEELKTLHRLLHPRTFVPVHGEYRHLVKHAKLAREIDPDCETFVLSNGQSLCVGPDSARLDTEFETGRIFVDGRGVGDLTGIELRDRRHLANHGVVNVILAVNQKTGDLLYGPEIFSRGFITEETGGAIMTEATEIVRGVLVEHSLAHITDWDELRVEVRKALRRLFNRKLDRRPLILPFILLL